MRNIIFISNEEILLIMAKKTGKIKKKTISVKPDSHKLLMKMHRGGETWNSFLLRIARAYDGTSQADILKDFLTKIVQKVYEKDDHIASFVVVEDIGKDLIIEMLSK